MTIPHNYTYIIVGILTIIILIGLYLMLTIVLLPFMQLFNKLTDKNISNLISQKNLLLGVVTEEISNTKTGEILVVDKQGAKIFPAKLYKIDNELPSIELKAHTNIIIIEINDGVAYVIKNNNIK